MLHRKKSVGGRGSGHSKRVVASAVGITVEALERRQLLAAQLQSVTPIGTVGDLGTTEVSVSEDGRYIAFTSDATNLDNTIVDDNHNADIYWRDTQTGLTRLITRSLTNAGFSATAAAGEVGAKMPVISPDGQWVAFLSDTDAPDLAAGVTDINNNPPEDAVVTSKFDAFLYSVASQTTSLVSADLTGAATWSDGASEIAMRDNGQHVAFVTGGFDAGDTVIDNNLTTDVILRDMSTFSHVYASVAKTGVDPGNGASDQVSISGDASNPRVAFESLATDLLTGFTDDFNGTTDVFVYDSTTSTVSGVSVMPSNTVTGNDTSDQSSISFDGKFVVFRSISTDLIGLFPDANNAADIYLRDLDNHTTELVSMSADGTSTLDAASANAVLDDKADHVAFVTAATNAVTGLTDANGVSDVFLRDRASGTNVLVSCNSWGTIGDGASRAPSINGDGTRVVFLSLAKNLISSITDTGTVNYDDLFSRDVTNGATRMISVSFDNAAYLNNASTGAQIARNPFALGGTAYYTYFMTTATNAVASDFNFKQDLFRGQSRRKQVAAAPINVQATNITTNSVDLSWTDNSIDEARFKVLRSDDGGITWMIIYKVAANTTEGDTEVFTDTGLAAGYTYFYRVVAANDSGDSDFANTLQADTTMPAVVAGTVWNDLNMNGEFDANEVGLPGVTVFADLDSDGFLSGTEPNFVSDVNGNYLLILVPPGTVNIQQIASADLLPTAPTSGIQTVSLGSGQVLTSLNFGLHNLAVNYSIEWDGEYRDGAYLHTSLGGVTWYTGTWQATGGTMISLHNFAVSVKPWSVGNLDIVDVSLIRVGTTNQYTGDTSGTADNGSSFFSGPVRVEAWLTINSKGVHSLTGRFFAIDGSGNRKKVDGGSGIIEGTFDGKEV